MRIEAVAAAFLAGVTLTGCGDLLDPGERVPSGVVFEESVVTATEGEPVELRPYVVDQAGNRIERLPAWAEFDWGTSDASVFDPWAGLLAKAPGEARARVTVAELRGEARVRVNPSSIDVSIPLAYMVQTVQRPDGSVPLVAGRAASLRVFVRGSSINFFQPDVEVRFEVNGTEVGTRRVGLTRGGFIPTSVSEGQFEGSWEVPVPAEWVRPGLAFAVALDPDGELPLAGSSPARFPAEGTRAVDVREVPDLELRFVPIHQARFNSTGGVSAGNAGAWTTFLWDVFPIAGIRHDVRGTFHTDAVRDGETDWDRIIQEIWALRLMDGDDRYYYGVLRQHGGYAGLGYVGWPVAIGWDDLRTSPQDPIPLAYSTFAHELGHNFGRYHAPACDPANADPDFPHPGGLAGVFGYHGELDRVTHPSEPDLMGYCRPRWVSDYTYEGVMDFRIEEEEWRRAYWFEESDAGPGLLVWGSIRGGVVELEPAIALDRARPLRGDVRGLTVEGRDASGRVLFRQPAVAMEMSHGPADARAFSAVVPLAPADRDRVHSIRVSGPGVAETVREGRLSAAPAEARDLAAGRAPAFGVRDRARPGASELVWDEERYPLVVVRDAGTGDVVAFARRGRLDLPVPADRLTFELSDGVRTVRARPVAR